MPLKSKMTKPGNVDTKKCVCAGEFATGALEGVLLTRGYDMLTLRKASTAFAVREKKRLKNGCSRCSVSILLVFVFGPEPVLANHHDSCRFMKVVELGCENCSQAIIFRCCCFRCWSPRPPRTPATRPSCRTLPRSLTGTTTRGPAWATRTAAAAALGTSSGSTLP